MKINSKEFLDYWLGLCSTRCLGIRTQTIDQKFVDVTFRIALLPLPKIPKEQLNTTIPIGLDIVGEAVERTSAA